MEGRQFKKQPKSYKIVSYKLQNLSLLCSQQGRLLDCDLAGPKRMLQRCGHASILQKDGCSLPRHTLVPGPSPAKLGYTEAPKWGAGLSQALCWGQEMNLQQVCWGWWSWKETAWFLAPQVPDVYFGGTDPDETPPFQSCVQPFFHLWAVSLAHITKSYIPWLLLRLCTPCSQDLPGAAHGSNLLGSSTLCPLPGEVSASLPTCVPLSFISSLPGLVSPLFWKLHPLYFFPCSDQSSASSRIPLLFFPHTINSVTQFQLSVALCL